MSTVICHCLGITEEDIIAAIKGGAHTVEAVGEVTKAGTICGGCISDIEALIAEHK